ncbi:exodeoxyribonuclease VII large subunit [Candidatus Saccharibacteria bacterium CG_4_10_14_0_2_um_filter_52_9]|nr:MAG: exodeoxyribonuclease VII large subunit [Candidatus Saccharibacteria bacterium CG_4_10_14_0_2_um_filter_52_9]
MATEAPAVELSVSDFVALLNQALEYAYSGVVIVGELANLRVSKNRWVYFDLKDEFSSVKFFGTVYQLPGPLEDGMMLKVRGLPKLHNLYGFSVNVQTIQPVGEGTIKRAAQLLQAKLTAEGLFDEARKRSLPYPPARIGLITSKQSAAYADFIKILDVRWRGLEVELIDVQVQGEVAPAQITAAIEQFNGRPQPPETLIIIRGGGSAEDLAAFSSEQVTRAVAASRVPTLVAIGHEIDLSLAELAADQRASTPSNAAELLVPDRTEVLAALRATAGQLEQAGRYHIQTARGGLEQQTEAMSRTVLQLLEQAKAGINSQITLLEALNPASILRRGYAIVRSQGRAVRRAGALGAGGIVDVQLADGSFTATVKGTEGIKS